jgi:hypothetical protein
MSPFHSAGRAAMNSRISVSVVTMIAVLDGGVVPAPELGAVVG